MCSKDNVNLFFSTNGISLDAIASVSLSSHSEFIIEPKLTEIDENEFLGIEEFWTSPEFELINSRELNITETRALLLSKAVNMAIKNNCLDKKVMLWILEQLKSNSFLETKMRYFHSDEVTLCYLLNQYIKLTNNKVPKINGMEFIKGYTPTVSQLSLYLGISSTLKYYGECVVALLIESMSFPLCFLVHLSTISTGGLYNTVKNIRWLLEDSKMSRESSWDDQILGIKLTEIICSLGTLENSIESLERNIKFFFTKSSSNTKSLKGIEGSIDYIEVMPLLEPLKAIISCLAYLNKSSIIFLENLIIGKKDLLICRNDFCNSKFVEDIKVRGLDIKLIVESTPPLTQGYLDYIETRIENLKSSILNIELINNYNIEKIYDLVLNFKKLTESNLEIFTIMNIISLQKLADRNYQQYVAIVEKARLKSKKEITLSSHESKNIHEFRLLMMNCLIDLKRNSGNNSISIYSYFYKYLANGSIYKFSSSLKYISTPRNQLSRLPKVPKGTQDVSPQKMSIKNLVFNKIREIYRAHGAVEIDTPVFELKDTLLGKYGEDSKLIYDLKDQGGEQLSLRYDLTVPLARYVATTGTEHLKRFQIGKVYRRDEPQMSRGRFREFYQCDLDIVGQYDCMIADAEIIKIATEVLYSFSHWIGRFTLKINHRRLLDGILEISGVPNEKFRTICSSVDKLDKEAWQTVKNEMVNVKGLTEDCADKIGSIINLSGNPSIVIDKIRSNKELMINENVNSALKELELLFKYIGDAKFVECLSLDLSLARGLDYYTGVIYEAVLSSGHINVGSIAAGGRYDKLIGMFSQKDIPAVGFSVGIERIMSIIENQFNSIRKYSKGSFTDFLICNIGDSFMEYRFKIASLLWDHLISCEISLIGNGKLKKQFDFASNNNIPYCIIVGEEEFKNNRVQIKLIQNNNLEKVSSKEVHFDQLISYIRSIINNQGSSYSKFCSEFNCQ